MSPIINYEKDIKGMFSAVSGDNKQKIMEIVANFHIRTGVHNPDSSLGEIKITPGQFNDCLAYMIGEIK